MKYLICFALLISSLLNAQDVVGTYELHSKSTDPKNFELKRTLTLNADGTFEYYNYRRVKSGIPPETHTYGKGTWTQNKKVISFSSEASDLDAGKEIYTTNCAVCHKADGGGGIGPNLTDENWILGGGIKNSFTTISEGGRPGKGMVSWLSLIHI